MIGILVLLIISWLLIYFTTKNNLNALGLLPNWVQLYWGVSGFFIAAVLCIETQFSEALLSGGQWINAGISEWSVLIQAVWWDFRSVLTEELVFRGALLYLMWHFWGHRLAIAISAVAFGVYHWFSFGVLGQLLPMILVFLGTGLMGWVLAWSFVKTRSLWVPFGIHFGWNLIHNTVFSKGPLGTLMFELKGGKPLEGWASLFNFLNNLLIPPLILLLILFFIHKKNHKVLT